MEARELANRILAKECGHPVPDAIRIQGVLKKIRARYPAMGTIRARMHQHSRTLVVQTTPAFLDTVMNTLDKNPGTQPPRTGDTGFDTLNTGLGLDRVVALENRGHLLLHFSDDLDIAAALIACTGLDTVQDVAPDRLLGDDPDVYITP